MSMIRRHRGFTLPELLVAVTIVGILAGVAYPAYQEQLRKTRRADAEGALLGLANAMERYFTENNTYIGAAGTKESPAPSGKPRIYADQAPVEGSKKYYDLRISDTPVPTATTYTLDAIPISSSPQGVDRCGILTLTNTGVKNIRNAKSGVTKTDCW